MAELKPLKTKYTHVRFMASGHEWFCKQRKERSKYYLGRVVYYERWKCHLFTAHQYAAFSPGCLRDIADFMQQLDERKTDAD